ncbi:hypothetical protein HanIR_Chr16g0807031 [Helianthus annuus]|nr:hypothetical protein HanIR_Chr16g0807031 [Helianthus annuus]
MKVTYNKLVLYIYCVLYIFAKIYVYAVSAFEINIKSYIYFIILSPSFSMFVINI